MAEKEISIHIALGKLETLKGRYNELCQLRNNNAKRTTRIAPGEKEVEEPTFDAKKLDIKVARIAKEIRILKEQIKETNAITLVKDYKWDDSILDEIN
jgi:hypothetical protein